MIPVNVCLCRLVRHQQMSRGCFALYTTWLTMSARHVSHTASICRSLSHVRCWSMTFGQSLSICRRRSTLSTKGLLTETWPCPWVCLSRFLLSHALTARPLTLIFLFYPFVPLCLIIALLQQSAHSSGIISRHRNILHFVNTIRMLWLSPACY